MKKFKIILAVTIFLALVVSLFVIAHLERAVEPSVNVDYVKLAPVSDREVLYPEIDRITAKHFFRDDTHIFVGELALPTPCDLLDAQVGQVAESFPEQAALEFEIINNADSCIQQVTVARFRIDAPGLSEAALFHAHFMGRDVPLNLIEGAEDESPDDFELFLKG